MRAKQSGKKPGEAEEKQDTGTSPRIQEGLEPEI